MTKRFRLRFTFWLDMLKEGESAVAETIDTLKKKRLFAETVRDGIRLVCDLRDGKLDVLFELFPWVRAEFLEYMRELTSETLPEQSAKVAQHAPHTDANLAWLEAEQERMEQERAWEQRRREEAQKALEAERRAIEQERQRIEAERAASQNAIQQQLARLEELLLSQGHQPIDSPAQASRGEPPPNHSGAPKQLSVQKFSTPAYDDDEEDEDLLEVKKDESAGMRATQNFLNSLMNLRENPPTNEAGAKNGRLHRFS